jgi:transcriptional regulator with XRE-family HTH domain
MDDFHASLAALMDERFENRARFAEATGASPAYITDIMKHKKTPKPAILREWLENAGIPEDKIERLVFLLRLERLRTDEDLAPLFTYFDDRIEHLEGALIQIVKVCNKARVKLPGEVVKLVESLEASREG